MIGDIHFKVCGLTRGDDARVAAELGADFLGFILYPKSPRYIALGAYSELAAALPRGPRRVAVMVEPSLADLDWAQEAGFDRFQIHARHDLPLATVHAWSDAVGPADLWLAPKLPPGAPFPNDWLEMAETLLVDTFHAEGFGGSGRTGDWAGFSALSRTRPEKTWILAGGLGPENIRAALEKSGTRYLDVNSGVETAPGIKSPEKLRALASALQGYAGGSRGRD
jgi:phosphoribosylanthranilate isomerase